jgi:BCD family chlorophyll transporter-like MFS transporter
MGLWGAAQAIAFGGGGLAGTVLVDLAKYVTGPSGKAYSFVFALEALGFFVAHWLALNTRFSTPIETMTLEAPAHVGALGPAHSPAYPPRHRS